ncbi:energy transducer TonB [Maricaulis parjimensis]|uniref:energy transducer TonB n=1 Tax=Maricaulis parjimensis TaxID=144023 RepID=UPI00193A8ACC|nr:energy transducer TonB [Maricaulis parjimensis]
MKKLCLVFLLGLWLSQVPVAAQSTGEPQTIEIPAPSSVARPYRAAQAALDADDPETALTFAQRALAAAQEEGAGVDMIAIMSGMVAELADYTDQTELAEMHWSLTEDVYRSAGWDDGAVSSIWGHSASIAAYTNRPGLARTRLARGLEILGEPNQENWRYIAEIRHFDLRLALRPGEPPEGYEPAEPAFRPTPPFGATAARAGVEGYVIVRFDVDEAGDVENVEIADAYPEGVFDTPSISTVSEWRYRPARQTGQAVREEDLLVRFDFQLAGRPEGE